MRNDEDEDVGMGWRSVMCAGVKIPREHAIEGVDDPEMVETKEEQELRKKEDARR